MKIVSIDIETSGLDPVEHSILEFGAVIDDLETVVPSSELPTFHRYILPPNDRIVGNPFALQMNAKILERIAKKTEGFEYVAPELLGTEFASWLGKHGIDPMKVIPAGKNFAAFDRQFLKNILGFDQAVRFRHRTLDPMMFYIKADDIAPPDMKLCLTRAGLDGEVPHTAVEDARLVVDLIRVGMRKLDARS